MTTSRGDVTAMFKMGAFRSRCGRRDGGHLARGARDLPLPVGFWFRSPRLGASPAFHLWALLEVPGRGAGFVFQLFQASSLQTEKK